MLNLELDSLDNFSVLLILGTIISSCLVHGSKVIRTGE